MTRSIWSSVGLWSAYTKLLASRYRPLGSITGPTSPAPLPDATSAFDVANSPSRCFLYASRSGLKSSRSCGDGRGVSQMQHHVRESPICSTSCISAARGRRSLPGGGR